MKLKEISVGKLQSDIVYIWYDGRLIEIKFHSNNGGFYSADGVSGHLDNLLELYGECLVKLKSEVQIFFEGDKK